MERTTDFFGSHRDMQAKSSFLEDVLSFPRVSSPNVGRTDLREEQHEGQCGPQRWSFNTMSMGDTDEILIVQLEQKF